MRTCALAAWRRWGSSRAARDWAAKRGLSIAVLFSDISAAYYTGVRSLAFRFRDGETGFGHVLDQLQEGPRQHRWQPC